MHKFIAALKRFFRVGLAGATAAGALQLAPDTLENPEKMLITVIITAAINGLAKYLREKWEITLPF